MSPRGIKKTVAEKKAAAAEKKAAAAPKKAAAAKKKRAAAKKKAAPKKRATAKKPARKTSAKKFFVDEDGFPCLTLAQLMFWRATAAEAESCRLELELKVKEITIFLSSIPKYCTLEAERVQSSQVFEDKSRTYMEGLTRLSAELGFDIGKCIINDKTGRITFTDLKGRPVISKKPPKNVLLGAKE